AWRASEFDLAHAGLDKRAIKNLLDARASVDLDRELAQLPKCGARLLTWDDDEYPLHLKEIEDPPPALYVRGALKPADEFAVAIVGTRTATAYGKEVARQLATDLARNQVTIVSGLARGIDLIAHEAALDAGGRTIAVLGCGVDIIYPPEARRLSERVIQHGALLSDYPLGTRAESKNFPPRNRIISGMSLGTIVVEADLESGALITASFALEQGRDVFAVPGNIYSKTSHGANRLIQQGAKLVTRVEDVLEELHLEQVAQQQETRAIIPQDETERTVWNALSHEPLHVDDLRRTLDLPISTISSTLILMELKGLARHVGGMQYIKAK
ncbi:MAG: DNA-processing protein DprA, partial [Chloroflexota bacterium]